MRRGIKRANGEIINIEEEESNLNIKFEVPQRTCLFEVSKLSFIFASEKGTFLNLIR